jgi:hypothetical protein
MVSLMAKASVLAIKSALVRERRTNKRLRALITELSEQVQANKRELNTQLVRVAQLQVEIDLLKLAKK